MRERQTPPLDVRERHGDTFRIVQKRVDLINCDGAFEAMAVPI